MPERMPAVGQIVHYVSYGTPVRADGSQAYTSRCRAAIITEVGAWVDLSITPEDIAWDGPEGQPERTVRQRWEPSTLALTVENPNGTFKDLRIHHGPGLERQPGDPVTELCDGLHHAGGTWHWPARV